MRRPVPRPQAQAVVEQERAAAEAAIRQDLPCEDCDRAVRGMRSPAADRRGLPDHSYLVSRSSRGEHISTSAAKAWRVGSPPLERR